MIHQDSKPKSESESVVDFNCPKCNSNVTRSKRRGMKDRVLSILNTYPYRCRHHGCKHRFYSFGNKM